VKVLISQKTHQTESVSRRKLGYHARRVHTGWFCLRKNCVKSTVLTSGTALGWLQRTSEEALGMSARAAGWLCAVDKGIAWAAAHAVFVAISAADRLALSDTID
jgi:hypothetical protein